MFLIRYNMHLQLLGKAITTNILLSKYIHTCIHMYIHSNIPFCCYYQELLKVVRAKVKGMDGIEEKYT